MVDPMRDVILRWSGPADVLGMSWLTDLDAGEVIEPDTSGSYAFVMNGQARRFRWEYEKRPGNSGKKR